MSPHVRRTRKLPIRLSKISSNDRQPLVYIPVEAMKMLNLKRGDNVIIYVDSAENALVIKPIPEHSGYIETRGM